MKRFTLGHVLPWVGALLVVASACGKSRAPDSGADGGTNGGPDGGSTALGAPANLSIALTAARVTPDGHVQVDYTLSDAQGAPLAGVKDATSNWTLAMVATDEAGRPAWKSLILRHVVSSIGAKGTTDQPTSENTGTTTDLGGGKYQYTYKAALPADAAAATTATFRAAVYSSRPIANTFPQQNDIANGVIDFVPAGGTPAPHDAVSTQACNQCHGILQAHGGARRETRLCATCHTTQLVDPDTNDTGDPSQLNPLDFPRMVHRIHRGKDLPTVQAAAAAGDADWKYHVIGFQNADNVFGGTMKNPNTATTTPPQPAVVATGVAFPRDLRDCAVCHAPAKDAQGNVQYAAQASDAWKTAPSVRACQACHDDAGFTASSAAAKYHEGHPGGLLDAGAVTQSNCANCHSPAVLQAIHTSQTHQQSFNAFKFQITKVSAADGGDVAAGKPVRVAFKVLNADGTPVTDLSQPSGGFTGANGRLAVTISGPTVEYQAQSIVTQAVAAATASAPATVASMQSATGDYTMDIAFPQNVTPTGTWAAGIEGRRKNTTLTPSGGPTVFDFGRNPVSYFAVGGGQVQPRRQVVATENCNQCHGVLSAHGNLRHDVEYCVMCHTPDNSDADQRKAAKAAGKPILDGLEARSIHFDSLIHSIHTGEELQFQQPFVVYGFGGNPTFLNEARFPGTRAQCAKCHQGATYTLDALPNTAAPTQNVQVTPSTVSASTGAVTTAGKTGTLGPAAAACLACHDTTSAHHHVTEMSQPPANSGTQGAENCRMCHGEGGPVPVSGVHGPFAR
jgi:OmcA/MtrC family decaheme c-type cytochrome